MRLPFLLLTLLACGLRAENPLDAFPEAEAGMTRHVIALPTQDEKTEDRLQIELIIGKTVETDGVNRYFFGGTLTEGEVEGMGYSFYRIEELGPMTGTLMAVPPDTEMEERFITIGGAPRLIRYNSRLPVVVYTPADTEVRYRIWRGDAETRAAEEG